MKTVFFFLVCGLLLSVAYAEVPEHTPSWDSKCPSGFQWSKGIAGCAQADCPSGAGRTYTYQCNCGEAWGKPFRTCYDPKRPGYAVACVAKGAKCPDEEAATPAPAPTPTPNPQTCASGSTLQNGKCAPNSPINDTYPKPPPVATTGALAQPIKADAVCRIVDLDGNPMPNSKVTFGEYSDADGSSLIQGSGQTATTNDNGEVGFNLKNKNTTKTVSFIFRGANGYYSGSVRAVPGSSNCMLTVYNDADVEKYVKKDYKDFLTRACISSELINKIDSLQFVFGDDGGATRYDGGKIYVQSGQLSSGFDNVQRTLSHEIGHFISEQMLDPDKIVGGKHDNWQPNPERSWYQFGTSDPEELAFEEGMADFMAMMYFAENNQTYQQDFATDQRARAALSSNGMQSASRTEGVITSFLYEYYKNQTKEQNGAAHSVGDFLRSASYAQRTDGTVPARNIKDWIAQKIKMDKNEPANQCSPSASNLPNMSTLVSKYGFGSDGQFRIAMEGENRTDAQADVMILAPPPQSLTNNPLINFGVPYELQTGRGATFLERFPQDYSSTGNVEKIVFKPGTSAFEISPDAVVIVNNGTAYVVDANVRTPHLSITHTKTRYIVEVKDGKETITVLEGSVDAVDSTTGKTVTIGEQQQATYQNGALSAPAQVSTTFTEQFWRVTRNPTQAQQLSCCAPQLIFLCLIAGFFLSERKK